MHAFSYVTSVEFLLLFLGNCAGPAWNLLTHPQCSPAGLEMKSAHVLMAEPRLSLLACSSLDLYTKYSEDALQGKAEF